MTDEEAAQNIERTLVGEIDVLGCGCLVKKICTHPNNLFLYVGEDFDLCALHRQNPRSLWLSKGYRKGYGALDGKQYWVNKENGEIVSGGYWFFKTEEYRADKEGMIQSAEKKHLIGKKTGAVLEIMRA